MNKQQPGAEASQQTDSLSRPQGATQPTHGDSEGHFPTPTAHVVLYQPEIPQNTGNIGRTCVATNAKLWIVRPAGFSLDNKRLSRAGLDYWQHLQLGDADNWEDLQSQLIAEVAQPRLYYLSRFAKREVWDADFQLGDVLVFGSESSGLPDRILDPESANALRLPTSPKIRSLNLATTVGICLY